MPRGGTATHGPRNPSVLELYKHHLDSYGWSDTLKKQMEEATGMPWLDISSVIISGIVSGGSPYAIAGALAASSVRKGVQEPTGDPKFKAAFSEIMKQAGTLDDFKKKYGITGNSVTPDVIARYNDANGLTGTPNAVKDNTAARLKYNLGRGLITKEEYDSEMGKYGLATGTQSSATGGNVPATQTNAGGTMSNQGAAGYIPTPKPVPTKRLENLINANGQYVDYIKGYGGPSGPNMQFAPGVLSPQEEAWMKRNYPNLYGMSQQPDTSGEDPNGNGSINTAHTRLGGEQPAPATSSPVKPAPPQYKEVMANMDDLDAEATYRANQDMKKKYEADMAAYNQAMSAQKTQQQQEGQKLSDMTIQAPQLYGANSKLYDEALNNYRDVIDGKKSYAAEMMKAGMSRSRQNLASVAATTRGINPALKAKQFLNTQRQMEGDVTRDAGMARSKEAIDAMSGFSGTTHNKTMAGATFQNLYNTLGTDQAKINAGWNRDKLSYLANVYGTDVNAEGKIIDSGHEDQALAVNAGIGKANVSIGQEANSINRERVDMDKLGAKLQLYGTLTAEGMKLVKYAADKLDEYQKQNLQSKVESGEIRSDQDLQDFLKENNVSFDTDPAGIDPAMNSDANPADMGDYDSSSNGESYA